MPNPIKVMQNELACVNRQITGCDKDCIKCDLVLEDAEIIAAYEAAIEALKSKSEAEEYRTAKKVRIIDRKYRKHVPFCPSCCNDITHFAMTPYCALCGQKLDWSEVE